MFVGIKMLSDILVEILVGLNVVKLSFLLIYIALIPQHYCKLNFLST